MRIVLTKTDGGRIQLESEYITVAEDYAEEARRTSITYNDGKHLDHYTVKETPDEIATLTAGGELPKEEVESATSLQARIDKLCKAEAAFDKKVAKFAEKRAQEQVSAKTEVKPKEPVTPSGGTHPFAGSTPKTAARKLAKDRKTE